MILRVAFFAAIGWLLAVASALRSNNGWDEWADDDTSSYEPPAAREDHDADELQPAAFAEEYDEFDDTPRRAFAGMRFATSASLVMLFFAGAAFTATAGDELAQMLENDPECAALMAKTGEDESVCSDAEAEAPSAEEEAAAPDMAAEPAEAPVEAAVVEAAAAEHSAAPAPEASNGSAESSSGDVSAQAERASSGKPASVTDMRAPTTKKVDTQIDASSPHWVVRRASTPKALAPAIEDEGGQATIWLNRALPDPTPPAKRLKPSFAESLRTISRAHGVHWSLVLGVLRAEGARTSVPATRRELNALAKGLRSHGAAKNEWNAVLAISGRTGFADRATALAKYNRAVGLHSLVRGLQAEKDWLAADLLRDPRANIYAGGRSDLQAGKIDVRVVVLIRYMAESFGQVTVSSLFSGHRLYARPGVVSAHIYGHAVDISAVGNVPIAGNQQPGAITERAVRSILMLPTEVQPRQLISLLGLGGPSFPMADHGDHIHAGF